MAVEVLKDKYPESDSEASIKKGDKATTRLGKDGKNRMEIFRFNPGKEKVIFPPNHPYSKVLSAGKVIEKATEMLPEEKRFIPKKLKDYETKLNVKADSEIFKYLNKETPLYTKRPKGIKGNGAFYNSKDNYVHIPIDARRKNSPWYAKAVIHHEYGHAADWHIGMSNSNEVKDLMNKHRKLLDFEKIDERLIRFKNRAINGGKKINYDLAEQVGATRDALKALNINYGAGHPDSYFRMKGMSEAEFIAHAFENTFSGNKVFKKCMPELYKDSIELVKGFKPKQ